MADFILEKDKKRTYRPGLFLAIIAIGAFIGWASLSEIDQHVRGFGRIIPASEKKVIQHLEGGIIADILITEGQQVEKGQKLFVVRNQDAASQSEEIRIRIASTSMIIKRLEAEYKGAKALVYSAEESRINPEMAANQLSQFRTRTQQFNEKINILQQQKRQKTLRLDDLATQLKNLKAERKTADDQFSINKKLQASGAVSQSKYLDSQSRVQSFNTRIAQIEKQIPVVRAELSEAKNRIGEEREKRKSELGEDIGQAKLELRQLQERIKASNDKVERRAVLSPATGLINKLYVNTRGGVIQPGAPLADLIPLDESLVVEAEISTDDRGQIWPDLPVNVRITAYDYTTFGSIKGTLSSISADSNKNDRGQELYTVKILLETKSIGNEKPLYPGMTAEVNIVTGKRKIMDYLLKPIRRVGLNALTEE